MNGLRRCLAIAATCLLPGVAHAHLQEEPTPVITASPEASGTPEARATPEATPEAAATPAVTPAPNPETAETPEPEATPEATPVPLPVDYLAGVAGSKAGLHPWTIGVDLGFHLFNGAGWTTTSSDDFEGGSIAAIVTYDIEPLLALVATAGGNSATHIVNPNANSQITTTLSSWYGDAGVRASTPPRPVRLWIEAAAGAYAASQQVETVNGDLAPSVILSTRGGLCGHLGVGGSYYVAQGLNVFADVRYMTAPGAFPQFPTLDMGGATFSVGASLRL